MKIFIVLVSLVFVLCGCLFEKPETNEIREIPLSKPEEETSEEQETEQAKIFLPLISFHESDLELPDNAVVEGKRVDMPFVFAKEPVEGQNLYDITLWPELVEEIQKDHPDFDPEDTGWKATVNFFAADGKAAMIKINYYIDENIITDKAVIATVEEGSIVRISYTNMDFDTDEEKIRKKARDFLDSTTQTGRIFEEGEEFLSEETIFHYHYPSDILVYSYQLYFYCGPEDMKVINNDYGYECIVE